MTLIIVACSGVETVLTSDCRGTRPDGSEVDLGKAVSVVWPRASFLVAYTGLAELYPSGTAKSPSLRTRTWLIDQFLNVLRPDIAINEVLVHLRDAATREVNRFRVTREEDKYLTIFGAGYGYTDEGAQAGAWQISNFENFKGETRPFGPFEIEVCMPEGGRYAAVVGLWHKEVDGPMNELGQLAASGAPGAALEGKSVEIIRHFAASPSSQGKIGATCTTSWLNFDPSKPVVGGHHAADGSGEPVMHDIVACDPKVEEKTFAMYDFKMDLTLTADDGTVHHEIFARPLESGLCSCGRNKRFEKSHGKPIDRRRIGGQVDDSGFQ